MTVAVFNDTAWRARYPNLAPTVSPDLAAELFAEAGDYCDNTDASPVPCDPVTFQPRLRFLGMLVAHLAILQNRDNAGDGGPVGRISDATQGSVSAKFEMAPAQRGADWYMQTPPGANFWQATATYRLGRFFGPPHRHRHRW